MNQLHKSNRHVSLDERMLQEGLAFLGKVDSDLAGIINELGSPPMWSRKPGFPTMLHIILEQQVSLASAKAAFTKLNQSTSPLTPDRYLEFTDAELKEFGFSRQKILYCRVLAKAVINRELDLNELKSLDDSTARLKLMQLKGIGPWTADIYLLMAMLRPDIWPPGDLALVKAIQEVKNLSSRPTSEICLAIAEQWKPWRAVAARVLWHYYLS